MLTGAAPSALSGAWDDFVAALHEHSEPLGRLFREQGIQTNEPQRCSALLPAFLMLAAETRLPLDLIELGPSAGLNLVFDGYRYTYSQGAFGEPDARPAFDVVERGEVPAHLLETPLEIRSRRGIDLSPIDLSFADDVMLLHSFLWPGLWKRAERLDQAIETFRTTPRPPELIRGDYVEALPGLLAERPGDALTVVFQTASTGYLQQGRYDVLRRSLDEAGVDGRPLAWVSSRRREERELESEEGWELEVRLWPEPARLVARADFHGNWLDWLAP